MRLFAASIIAILCSLSLGALLPTGYSEKLTLRFDKNGITKRVDYFSFSKDKPLEFALTGKRRYKAIFRSLEKYPTNVSLELIIDGKRIKTYTFKKGWSKFATVNGKRTTMGYTVQLQIPAGKHSVVFKPDKPLIGKVYAVPTNLVGMIPEKSHGEEKITVGDQEYDYFYAPVSLVLEGPLMLHIYSRLLYKRGMQGVQHYSLTVTDNGKPTNYRLETSPSASASCTDREDVLISSASKLTYSVTAGKHSLVVNAAGGEALIKLYIPKGNIQEKGK